MPWPSDAGSALCTCTSSWVTAQSSSSIAASSAASSSRSLVPRPATSASRMAGNRPGGCVAACCRRSVATALEKAACAGAALRRRQAAHTGSKHPGMPHDAAAVGGCFGRCWQHVNKKRMSQIAAISTECSCAASTYSGVKEVFPYRLSICPEAKSSWQELVCLKASLNVQSLGGCWINRVAMCTSKSQRESLGGCWINVKSENVFFVL
jgi:hypothetical protein